MCVWLLLLLLSNLLCVIDFECGKNADFNSLAHLIVINPFDYMLIQIVQAVTRIVNKAPVCARVLCIVAIIHFQLIFEVMLCKNNSSKKKHVEYSLFMMMRLTYD